MADKLLKYDVAMKSTKTVWQMDTPKCYTGDENTVTFDFNITDLEEADLVGVIPNVYLYMRDGSFFQNGPADGVEITGAKVNYTMKGNEGKHSGIAKAQLVLVWDDGVNPAEKLMSQLYEFEVVSGLENKVAVEVMIQDWTTLTKEARTFIDTSANEVDALKGELQTAINTANDSLGEFDIALQNGIVAANIAEKLEDFEEINNSRLSAAEQSVSAVEAQVDLLNRGLGTTMASMALLLSTYPTGDTKDHIVAGNIAEVDTLTVTAIPTVAGNITVTLNGIAKTITVDPAVQTTTTLLATLIRGTTFTGWTTGGTGSVVNFTATTDGARTAPTFAGGITGVTATFAIIVKGEDANYHRYFWSGTAWTDGGLYQAIEANDSSITPSKLKTTVIPLAKNLNNYTTVAATPSLYIPFTPLEKGIVNLVGKFRDGIVDFYLLKKVSGNFVVQKRLTKLVVEGANSVITDFWAEGTGDEYIGFIGKLYFRNSGGVGFYEAQGANPESNLFAAPFATVGALYDFSVYPTYSNIEIVDQVKDKASVEYVEQALTFIASVELTDFYMPHYSEIVDPIAYLGRWFDKTIEGVPCKVTINEGSEFYFKVKNTLAIAVNFKVITSSVMPYFAYSIDGAPLVRQLITNPNLPAVTAAEHIIRIVCDGLTEGENKWVGEIGFAVTGVTVDGGGTVTGILPKNRKIMFFGDSITEGIRVLNMNANSDGNSGSGAFPFTTCSNLNAISYRVGFGASGVTHGGSGGVPDCLQYIDKMTSLRDAPYFEPDAIVINHGTNDAGSTSAVFQAAYNAVLDRLRIKYAGTPIFTMIPFNQAKAADIRACVANRSDCYLVETSGWGVTYTDGTHPDIAGGITAGLKLADAIKAVLGEGYFIK